MGKFKELGQLGIGRMMMEQIAHSGVSSLKHAALEKVQFGPSSYDLERMAKSAKKISVADR